jgi:cobalt-zinc-cadmium resistance protein CzcA
VIRPALRTVPGVADVNALGGMVESFEVAPDSRRWPLPGFPWPIWPPPSTRATATMARAAATGEEALIVRSTGAIRTLMIWARW